MKTLTSILATLVIFSASAPGAVIISQYVETDSGTSPKGIELWNTGSTIIDFSATNLVVSVTFDSGTITNYTWDSGTISPNEIIVLGTSDIGTYLDDTFGDGSPGSSPIQFFEKGFSFNGDDALAIKIGTDVQDTFGTPGSDPGSAWTGNGVSTANQNIALLPNITSGDADGWTDPSTRFATVSTTPSATGGLTGFGLAPVPEPSTLPAWLLCLVPLIHRKRTK